jgi:hypothetical protein
MAQMAEPLLDLRLAEDAQVLFNAGVNAALAETFLPVVLSVFNVLFL